MYKLKTGWTVDTPSECLHTQELQSVNNSANRRHCIGEIPNGLCYSINCKPSDVHLGAEKRTCVDRKRKRCEQ